MKTIAQRNEEAFTRLQEKHKESLQTEVSMTMGDIVQLTQAAIRLSGLRPDFGTGSQLTYFLMVDVSSCECCPLPRYETVFCEEGLEEALSDWDSRYEMGK